MSGLRLVSYGGDSDDDEPQSHGRRQSRSSREDDEVPMKRSKRDSEMWNEDEFDDDEPSEPTQSQSSSQRDDDDGSGSLREPPPPSRQTDQDDGRSPSMPRNESLASLSAFHGADSRPESPKIVRAPARAASSEEGEDSGDESRAKPTTITLSKEEEDEMDALIEQGVQAVTVIEHSSTTTPAASSPHPGLSAPPVELPPSPAGECDPALERKFADLFEHKGRGMDVNRRLMTHEMQNPSIYEMFIERYNLDEVGTNFERAVYDPNAFSKDCYYDRLNAIQNRMMEREAKKPSAGPQQMGLFPPTKR